MLVNLINFDFPKHAYGVVYIPDYFQFMLLAQPVCAILQPSARA